MPPPKNSNEIQEQTDSNMTDLHSTHVYYPQQQQHTRSLSDISVGEILVKYQDDSQLLNHILLAKAQEDKRRTAEELRQAEEARLQTKFIEFELSSRQDTTDSFVGQSSQNNSIFNTTSSFLDQRDEFSDHSSSLQAGLDNSTTSPLHMSYEFQYTQQQQQENVSIASSSPSIDFISPSNFDLYTGGQDHMMLSSSPPSMAMTTEDLDLPLFPPTVPPSSSATVTPTPIPTAKTHIDNNTKRGAKGKKKASSSPPKNMHRTLSYESVMTLSDLNMNRKPSPSPPPPPPQPLDHEKVMEALRAKLRKSSSPYQNSRPSKPSPEPTPPPPPNTYPTTGVLLLNLKSRRRKSSVTKRSNSGSSSSGGSTKP